MHTHHPQPAAMPPRYSNATTPRWPFRLPGFDTQALPRLTLPPMVLTRREIEVLAWVARGRTDWQIAEILYLSVKTVNYHVQRAKSKLGVSSRTHAVASAVALGYGPAFEDAASVSVEADADTPPPS